MLKAMLLFLLAPVYLTCKAAVFFGQGDILSFIFYLISTALISVLMYILPATFVYIILEE